MSEYKSNSHRSKNENRDNKKVEKVVSGKARVKKKSGISKLKDNLISEDVDSVKSYAITDVLIPAAKKAISDIVTNGIDMILYGETRSKKGSNSISYVSYDRFSGRDSRSSRNSSSYRQSSYYTYDDIVLDSRGEAEEVLRQMDAIIEEFDVASVADLYDLVGISRNFTDQRYGWDNLSDARVERLRDGGYMLRMPRAKTID